MQRQFLFLFLLIPCLAYGADNATIRLNSDPVGVVATVQNVNRTVIDINISYLNSEIVSNDQPGPVQISLPDEFGNSRGAYLGPGKSIVPTITRLIAVPFDSHPTFRIVNSDYVVLDNMALAQGAPEDIESFSRTEKAMTYNNQRELVSGEIAGIMRDLTIYALTISPIQYDSDNSRLRIYDKLEVEISHGGTKITQYSDHISEAFLPIYKGILDNPQVFDPIQVTRGAYWIIYPDAFTNAIQPLADWKKSKGFDVITISRSAIGVNSYTNIKNYIQARFDSCQVKPDYIDIVGDVLMPSNAGIATREYTNPFGFGDIESDNFYTFLAGSDYFPEVLIGRTSIDNLSDLTSFVDKLFMYERTPYMGDTGWYLRGTVVAGSDGYSFTSPRLTKMWSREAMMQHGFTQVDTFFAGYSQYIPPSEINASIDNGVAYVNYRGYGTASEWTPPTYSSDDMSQLTNVNKYPIMTSIVCGTGDFNDQTDVCFGENWIRGYHKGGVGFIGNSNHDAHTRWTNAIDVGIYWGLFDIGVSTLAQAELMGKITLYNAFPEDRAAGGEVELYFNSYNILGEPEVNCWTGIPRVMNVIHPDSIPLGQNMVNINVLDNQGGPITGAAVCIWKGNEVFMTGFTDENGYYVFAAKPTTEGNMKVTVTAQGYIPREDTIIYYTSPLNVVYSSHVIDDDSDGESLGDGDGTINPSERIEFPVVLANLGSADTAFNVMAVLSCNVTGVNVSRATASYYDILPGQSASPDRPFFIRVGPNIPNGTIASFIMDISDSGGHTWQSILKLPILAPQMAVDSVNIIDFANGVIDPGETFDIRYAAQNIGPKSLLAGSAILRTLDSKVHILDSTAVFGPCPPNGWTSNDNDHFMVTVDSDIYVGHLINFTIDFIGLGPQIASTSFNQTVGVIASSDPIGPDNYGYYCFDNSDLSYNSHPSYNWIDISTSWNYMSLGDDDVATIPLPFQVKYYGQIFDSVTFCDNGYITMGPTWMANFYNAPIPSPQNAQAMIAPFWDDFTQNPIRIYYNYDTVSGKFIIGWRNAYDGDNLHNETFEIIILDEAMWPTVTDDNEIIFQYNVALSPTTMSVGICSPDRRDGIGYLFNGSYAPGAASLISGRAIKFTTGSLYSEAADDPTQPKEFSLSQNYPNPFNARTIISFDLPKKMTARLEIFNLLGQKIETLLDGEFEPGSHSVDWNGADASSGIYFYRLTTADKVVSRRMTLIK
jgi:hypothetical protein